MLVVLEHSYEINVVWNVSAIGNFISLYKALGFFVFSLAILSKTMSDNKKKFDKPTSSAESADEEMNPRIIFRKESSLVLPSVPSKLSDILDLQSSHENSIKQAVAMILQKDNFTTVPAGHGVQVSKIASLSSEIQEISTKLDDMERYLIRNCLNISGILEEKEWKHRFACAECN